MISLAIEIEPGSSSFDGAALLQSPSSSAARTSSRVNHAASAISPSLNENSCVGVADGVEADHQRARKRPRLAAQVTHVADGQADLLGDLAGDAGLRKTRRPRRTRPAARTSAPATPSGGPAPRGRAPSCTRQITAGSMRGNSSCPVIGLTRDQPPLAGLVGEPSIALNRALSCQFSNAVADDTSWLLVSSKIGPSLRRFSTSASTSGSSGRLQRAPDRPHVPAILDAAKEHRVGRRLVAQRGRGAEHHPAVGDQHLVARIHPQQQRAPPIPRSAASTSVRS